MFVFGRSTTAEHGNLETAARELIADPEESLQAVGWNILYDHRVSEARAADFYDREKPTTARSLERALRDYFWEIVCKRPSEESYLSSDLNEENFVDKESLPSDNSFAHVLNLSAWAKVLSRESHLNSFLRNRKTLTDDERFLSSFFSAINGAWDRRPIWLARWSEFQKMIEPGLPSTWNNSVGIWRQIDECQIVLRIGLSAVNRLVRPTQLDAGFYQYHFPSPPIPPDRGGLAMELREVPSRRYLAAEWIHPPIPIKFEHWFDGGSHLALVEESHASTMLYRDQHRQRLNHLHPGSWIPPR